MLLLVVKSPCFSRPPLLSLHVRQGRRVVWIPGSTATRRRPLGPGAEPRKRSHATDLRLLRKRCEEEKPFLFNGLKSQKNHGFTKDFYTSTGSTMLHAGLWTRVFLVIAAHLSYPLRVLDVDGSRWFVTGFLVRRGAPRSWNSCLDGPGPCARLVQHPGWHCTDGWH